MTIASKTIQSGPPPPRVIIEPKRFSRLRLVNLWTMDLYIARCFLAAYVVCTVSFVAFYVIVEAFFKLHKFLPSGASSLVEIVGSFFRSLAHYSLAMVPTIYVNYMGPILTLAAAMFALTMLNRGNEFTAFKAAGVSVYRIVAPIFLLAAILSTGALLLQEFVIPELREPIRNALAISQSGTVRPDGFYDPVNDLHVQVRRYYPDTKIAKGINVRQWSLSHRDSDKREKLVIDAETMQWMPAADSKPRDERGHWVILTGSVQRWDSSGNLKMNAGKQGFQLLKEQFVKYRLDTSLLPIDLETSDQDISYLSWKELKTQYRRQPDQQHLLVKLHHRFAFPLSHFILLLLGVPFVVNFGNRSFVLGLAICLSLCAAYFLLGSMTLSLASDPGDTVIPPVIAAWLPNTLFGALGLTIFTNMRT